MAPDPLLKYGIVQAKGYYFTVDPECPARERDTTKYSNISALERRRQYVERLQKRDITSNTAIRQPPASLPSFGLGRLECMKKNDPNFKPLLNSLKKQEGQEKNLEHTYEEPDRLLKKLKASG
ncbi:hypothetical protein LTS15_001907 [Exophiala xenobiotica]|nr:hypothetical protein LTS15_001907 [Exophiala xenobiotica]